MASNPDISALSGLDWSKFDFTRWNLEGLPLSGSSATVASLLQKVTSSPQWPQSFGSTLPAIKTLVVQHLNLQLQTLQERSAALDKELATRTDRVKAQLTALQSNLRAASVPPAPAADPNKFQFVAKAVDQQSKLGLPSLAVQLVDPRNPAAILASGTTDSNGNAILSLTKEQADSLSKENVDLTLKFLNPAGKMILTSPNAICAQANHVETQVSPIASSPDTADMLAVANQLNATDTSLLSSLNTQADQLTAVFAARKQDVQNKITQIQSTISAIQAELNQPAQP